MRCAGARAAIDADQTAIPDGSAGLGRAHGLVRPSHHTLEAYAWCVRPAAPLNDCSPSPFFCLTIARSQSCRTRCTCVSRTCRYPSPYGSIFADISRTRSARIPCFRVFGMAAEHSQSCSGICPCPVHEQGVSSSFGYMSRRRSAVCGSTQRGCGKALLLLP